MKKKKRKKKCCDFFKQRFFQSNTDEGKSPANEQVSYPLSLALALKLFKKPNKYNFSLLIKSTKAVRNEHEDENWNVNKINIIMMFNMETILYTRKNTFCPKSDLYHYFNIEPIRGDNEPCNAKFVPLHFFTLFRRKTI